MIVIDASALAKYLLREPGYDAVEQYLLEEVYSVDHVVKEVANAIWKHAIVYKKIDLRYARELYKALSMLLEGGVLVVEPESKYMHQAFEIATNYEITLYDALYIAQAREKGSGLLTSDKAQASIAGNLGVTVLYL